MARTWLLGAVSMVTIAAGATDATPASTPAARGQELFVRSWIAEDPQAGEDGLGPYFNAESCVACHGTGGVGGSGGVAHNARLVASMSSVQPLPRFRVDGAPDLEAELLRPDRLTVDPIRPYKDQMIEPVVVERNAPALFGVALLEAIPSEALTARIRAAPGADRGVRYHHEEGSSILRLGWKGDVATIREFVAQACNAELGLSTSEVRWIDLGEEVFVDPTPTDLTDADVDALTAFVSSLPRPVERSDAPGQVREGREHFAATGCTDCHAAKLGELEGAYTDLMLHDLGRDLGEPISAGAYGGRRRDDLANLWRTPPLWGVADSAPYLHDGRASTLDEAIRLHGGEASWSTRRYDKLSDGERAELLAFLAAQRAPTSLDQPSSSQPREASGKASKSGM